MVHELGTFFCRCKYDYELNYSIVMSSAFFPYLTRHFQYQDDAGELWAGPGVLEASPPRPPRDRGHQRGPRLPGEQQKISRLGRHSKHASKRGRNLKIIPLWPGQFLFQFSLFCDRTPAVMRTGRYRTGNFYYMYVFFFVSRYHHGTQEGKEGGEGGGAGAAGSPGAGGWASVRCGPHLRLIQWHLCPRDRPLRQGDDLQVSYLSSLSYFHGHS